MKRRNVDLTKLRRPMKSKKISEGVYSSVFGYIKFLAVWGLVLLADFILEFRFEYLYPVWLLIRTVQDSYKYQGVLLTMLFLAVAIGTDIFCYVFIPVQWLFFAASSYVWVQYVWHTDKGICVSSASLWLLFVYVEAALRMKDHKALPFNMDLCRPFAAHCIGYPVVTLGYGIKTAASESIRRRTRTKVKKSNLFYQQLLQDALPLELQQTLRLGDEDLNEDLSNTEQNSKKDCKEDSSDSGSESSDMTSSSTTVKSDSNTSNTSSSTISSSSTTDKSNGHTVPNNHHHHHTSSSNHHKSDHRNDKTAFIEDFDAENESRSSDQLHRRNINDLSEEAENALNDSKSNKVQNKDPPVSKKVNNKRNKNNALSSSSTVQSGSVAQHQQNGGPNLSNGHHTVTANGDATAGKSEYQIRLEADVKRLKADLQSSRNTETDLRSQLNSKSTEDRQRKATLAQLQQDNESLQNKLHNVVMSRQQDKQNLAALEKKLSEEKKLREKTESQLANERKTKKQEDQVAARAVALASANRNADCVGSCKNKVKELEDDISKLKWDITRKDDQIRQLESDSLNLRKFKESHTDNNEVLMSALAAMQDKTAHLENSLSAETKIKMELFSALGEVKRQMEIQRHMLAAKDTEIAGLRSHITDALALVPSSMYGDQTLVGGQYTTPKLGSPTAGQPYIPPDNTPAGGMMFTQPPPTSHTRHSVSSPRFSPVQHQVAETVSPARTPVSSESGVSTPVSAALEQQQQQRSNNSALNPQAKDYRPGTQPATQ